MSATSLLCARVNFYRACRRNVKKCRTTPDLMFHETGVYASGCPVDGKYAILARRLLGKVLSGNGSKVSNARFRFMPCTEYGAAVRKKQGSCIHLPDGFGTGFPPNNSEKPFSGLPFLSLAVRKRFSRALSVFVRRIFFAFKRLKNHSLEIKC